MERDNEVIALESDKCGGGSITSAQGESIAKVGFSYLDATRDQRNYEDHARRCRRNIDLNVVRPIERRTDTNLPFTMLKADVAKWQTQRT
jgi:hypothetical protein